MVLHIIAFIHFEHRQFGMADDYSQHVVVIMCYSASQRADRLHLLRLKELILQQSFLRVRSFAVGYIANRFNCACNVSYAVK